MLLEGEQEALVRVDEGVMLETSVRLTGSALCVILLHAYAPLGGVKDMPLVVALATSFHDMGITTMRVNSRGAGGSGGRTSWNGAPERRDVSHLVRFLQEMHPDGGVGAPQRFVLVGYSHGSIAASAAASEIDAVVAFAALSYPFGVSWALTLFNSGHAEAARSSSKPKLLFGSTQDNFTGQRRFDTEFVRFSEPKTVVIEQGDHFWFRREGVVVRAVQNWFRSTLFDETPAEQIRELDAAAIDAAMQAVSAKGDGTADTADVPETAGERGTTEGDTGAETSGAKADTMLAASAAASAPTAASDESANSEL